MTASSRLLLKALLLAVALGGVGCFGGVDPVDVEPDGDAGRDAGEAIGGGNGDGGEDPEAVPSEFRAIWTAHNLARANEGMDLPPLEWDAQLAEIAQEWADGCVFEHNPGRGNGYDGPVGENLAAWSGGRDAYDPVAIWMDEKPNYDHATGQCAPGKVCGHYTQVVWRNTTRVGCGYAHCASNPYPHMVVCDYAPAGNVSGQKPY